MTGVPILEAAHAATSPPVLRLLSSRGLPRQGVLSLRLEGRGMADALALAEPHLNDVEWRDANRCRIVWRTEGWMLSNESRTWVCALNGSRIQTGEQAILQIGDMLELGLTRFLVDKEQSSTHSAEQSAPVARSPWLDDATAGSDGAEGRTASSRFVDRHAPSWHGVSVPSVDPAFVAPVVALTASRAQLDRSHVAARTGGLVAAASSTDAATALLVGLHEEFLRVVRNPAPRAGSVECNESKATTAEVVSALDTSKARGQPCQGMRNIPLRSRRIDQILDGFGPSGDTDATWRATVFGTQDVLRLFALDYMSAAASHLPNSTPRTPHGLSPDSPI